MHLRDQSNHNHAFTLVELLVIILVIGILAGLLLSALARSKGEGLRAICLNNLKQINQAVHLYADDYNNLLFSTISTAGVVADAAPFEWTAFVPRIRSYVGLKGAPSSNDAVLACPSDQFCFDFSNNGAPVLVQQSIHVLSNWNFSSYCFNAGNAILPGAKPAYPGMFPGVLGLKLNSIRNPARTILLAEYPARDPFSWHQPAAKDFVNNSKNTAAFADGHANYIRFYFGAQNPQNSPEPAYLFDPPANYDYQWSAN
jgi:type II secretory pathway pseudopilin PulG